MATPPKDARAADPFVVAGRTFTCRLWLGTGGMASIRALDAAIEASGAELTTVAVRRVNLTDRSKELDARPARPVL